MRCKNKSPFARPCGFMLVCSIVVASASFPACASEAEEVPGVEPAIRCASEIGYPPFCMVDADGQATGFSVELMRAALAAVGREVRFGIGTWADVKASLERGEVQTLPLVGRTPERESLFDFTFPYMTMHGALVVRRDMTDIASLDDLRGRRVAVMEADNAEEFLRREDRGIDIRTTPTFEAALRGLSAGQYDAVVIQRLTALRILQDTELVNLRILDKSVEGFSQVFCFAVKEGDADTLALLNEGLALTMADGTYRRLHAKWFGALELPPHRRIVVGGDHNYPPFEYLDETGRPSGFTVELTRAIAQEMGLEIEVRLGPWSDIVSGLETGEIDVIQGMFFSPARSVTFDFSPAYMVKHYVSVVRKGEGAPPASAEELAGKRIVVQRGDLINEFVTENGLSDQVSFVETQEDVLRELAEGRHDCGLVVRLSALHLIKERGWEHLELGRQPLASAEYCYAVRKDHKALLAEFAEGLDILDKTGEYHRIYTKWLGSYEDSAPPLALILWYVALVVAPLALILVAAMAWSWSLRKQVRLRTEELRQSEEFQRAMIACSPVALYSIDPNGHVLTWNASAERLFGWAAQEVVGKPLPIVPEDKQEEFATLRRRAAEGQIFLGKEVVRRRKDGSLFWGSLSAGPVRDASGRTIAVMASMLDITERKEAQERAEHLNKVLRAIREVNQLIVRERDSGVLIREACRLLVEHRGYASALIVLTDEDGRPVSWAGAGVADADNGLHDILDHGELPPCCVHFQSAEKAAVIHDRTIICGACPITGACAQMDSLCTRLIQGGVTFGYLVAAAPHRLGVDEEELELFTEMATDLAYALRSIRAEEAREEAEQERTSLEKQLLQAQKMEAVGRLAGGVAHDFNNMLGLIIGRAELALGRMSASDPLRADLAEILNAAKRSTEITRQLLAFARRQTISPKVLDLNDAVETTLQMLRRLLGEDIDLAWLPKAGLWPVLMDPSQLDQVLANLCVNARDAIAGMGKITIETENLVFDERYCADHPGFVPGEFVMLSVSDDGCGMDEDVLAHIFEPFFTTKDANQGTGLGLATVYGIVKQNHGFVNVYSEPGTGTTFKVYLPRHAGEVVRTDEKTLTAMPRSRGETVLLVEDEPAIMRTSKLMLERLGYRVLATGSPSEALALAERHAGGMDLLITDVVMPEMNGRELAAGMRSLYPDIRILFMSGYTANVIAHRSVLEKGVDFIQKPFFMKELAAKVREALDREP